MTEMTLQLDPNILLVFKVILKLIIGHIIVFKFYIKYVLAGSVKLNETRIKLILFIQFEPVLLRNSGN
jgi:hypothetical protein